MHRGLPDRLHGDSDKLTQCLECLLDNAIKFTRVGGLALRVTGKPVESDRLALSFAVIDTGIGFTDLGGGNAVSALLPARRLDDP